MRFFSFFIFSFWQERIKRKGGRGVDDGGDSGGDLEKGWFDVLCR